MSKPNRDVRARRMRPKEFKGWGFDLDKLQSWAATNAAMVINEFADDLFLTMDYARPGEVHLSAFTDTADIDGGEFTITLKLDPLFTDDKWYDWADLDILKRQLRWFKKHARRLEKHITAAEKELKNEQAR